MPIVQQGSINTAALVVPDLYVQIVPPQNIVLNGVPTNVLGIVGTASWGAVNQPVTVGGMPDYTRSFGAVIPRKYDMGTHVATAYLQGASNFRCVRISDGTDTAANSAIAAPVGAAGANITARYTGSSGSKIGYLLTSGSKTGTYRFTVYPFNGTAPEVFDNIPATVGQGAAAWAAIIAAVNTGIGQLRGASAYVVLSAGTSTADPSTAVGFGTTASLTGGTDGATTIASSTLVGFDGIGTLRTGMYALRGTGASVALLADADDPGQYTLQAAYGLSEGTYMITTGPSGDTITTAITAKQTAGLDSYAVKPMFGDWLYWPDPGNQVTRLVSPQGFVAGRLANLSPEQSSLNKPLYGIVGSQKSGGPAAGMFGVYSSAELQQLFQAGLDVIANPAPGGLYWAVRDGHNSSSNPATSGDNYTRLTNFIAATLAAGMGVYVGQVINATLFRRIRATLLGFLNNLLGQGILGSTDGSLPFAVVCDITNNPDSRTSLNYVQADVLVKYQAINEKFIVNLQGGQTVVVPQSSQVGQTYTAQAAAA